MELFFKFYNHFLFSMSLPLSKPKEGVIHLGLKSPRNRIHTNHENNASYTLSNTSQIEQKNLNYSNILG